MKMNQALSIPAVILALLTLGPGARAQEVHKNPEFGFQVTPPKGWKQMLLSHNEKWIVAKFRCHKDYWGKKESTYHRPELKVILFAKVVVEDRGVKVEKSKDDKVLVLKVKNPFKNFEEYLKAHAQGGYYEVSRKEKVIRKVPVTCIELKFEKLTTPRRALAYIYHHRDGDYALYVEGLEDYWKRLKPRYLRSLKSFRFIKRTGSLIRKGGTSNDGAVTVSTAKLTPKERAAQRKKSFDREVKAIMASLPKGWRKQKSKNVVALTHTSPKYTNYVIRQTEAVRKWLRKHFDWIGEEKAGRTLLRICENSDEESSLVGGSRDAWGKGFEVITHRDIGGGVQSYELQWVNRRVVGIWFRDKNKDLAWGMPSWLNTGIRQVLSTARLKGSALVLKPDVWELNAMRELARGGKIVMPREILTASGSEFSSIDHSTEQAGTFIRFLLSGPKKYTKGVIQDYMRDLIQVMEQDKRREEKEKGKATHELTEAEEAARFKERRQKEKKRLEEVFELSFGDWSKAKWKKFDRAYKAFAEGK